MTSFRRLILLLTLTVLLVPQLSEAKGVRRIKLTEAHAATPVTVDADSDVILASEEPTSCQFESQDKPSYGARFLAVRKKGVVAKGELFETKVYVTNTGNMPWFSADSGCPFMNVNLGTDKDRDRVSVFYTKDLMWESDWAGPNRVRMETMRVDPGEVATFRFWSKAPNEDGLYREYFTPVMEGVSWMEGGGFHTDMSVGSPDIKPENKQYLQYIERSVDLTKVILDGEKSIHVSIGQQKMRLKIGDVVIREFPVSTGTYRTPTPLGTTYILGKQQVRVASGRPHYIMPKWMSFRRGGYGIHALPSLANDNGVFWREALNHIGTRRSHGCIRLLPKDAEFAYEFGEVGTKVVVGG
ncbi:MAG TPA: L,D-transpeptidase [Candidatus Gracilibacteria bacterium]|nr:L,D-transpeptidase [Candidatus Gracilibacteria bacterium]